MNGQGILKYPNGDWYEVHFQNDQKHGNSTFHLDDGRYYTATWINDRINGKIRIIWPNGDQFTRNFTNDYINGYGNANSFDERMYLGEFQCIDNDRKYNAYHRKQVHRRLTSSTRHGYLRRFIHVASAMSVFDNVVFGENYALHSIRIVTLILIFFSLLFPFFRFIFSCFE